MPVTLTLFLFSVALGAAAAAAPRERVYYVGIIEAFWDYAPSEKNLITGREYEEDESAFLKSGKHRIGSVYKKAMFRQYDASYTHEAPRDDWLGFLGPVIKAEVGDVIVVHLKNFANRSYSIHPHGVFYEKNAEGALYPDGTSGRLKADDGVPPGGSYTYRWEVRPEYAPTEGDTPCLTWAYHSHVEAPRDIASGLIGALLTCKTGVLKEPVGQRDVDRDVFLMFNVVDESLSWYLESNILEFCKDPDGVNRTDEAFKESNLMHAINGYMFGNLPGIQLCLHQPTSWHLFGMGNEVDIHSAYFHGNTVLDRGHRTDVLSLFPATFATAEMFPTATGKWLLSCQVNDHLQAGMQAFYTVNTCGGTPAPPRVGGVVREYYLAAEEVEWSYAPSGRDLINNISLTDRNSASEAFFGRGDGRIGGCYLKARYMAYTDDTFTTNQSQPEHLGILGPVLRAEEGDILRVTFKNNAGRNFSIQPHGLNYDKRFQGTSYVDGVDKPGSRVAPGEAFVYTWQVLEGPSPSDPACIPYLYYSAVEPVGDTNAGLVGPLLVCRAGSLTDDGTLKNVDKEMFLLFSVMDENESQYLEENINKSSDGANPNREDEAFKESNKMHAVNGLMYGNLPGLEMCAGDRVVWYTLGLGTEVDIHGVYFEGNTVQRQNTTREGVSLFPHTTATVTMQPNTVGKHEVSCQVTDHFSAGMRQQYQVKECRGRSVPLTRQPPSGIVRYFISAEEIEWDYSPDRTWELEKHNATAEDSPGNEFVGRGEKRIGSRYMKAVYREYTDDTFQTQKERAPHQQHFGILGPLIRAEVGEQILITFKNKANRSYSIHAHGIHASDVHAPVQPGFMTEFRWDVSESSGPGPSDPPCIPYAYYSSVDFIKDMYSGLIGPLVVCRRGTLSRDATPERTRRDVEKEFTLLFMIFNENESWYLDDNIEKYLKIDPEAVREDEDFKESNKMHGINGRLYANLHGLEMTQGQKVDWYLLGMGTEVDLHTVHFHAETFTYWTDRVHRADVFDLFPGTFQTVEMVAGNPGTWLLHCHVTKHIHAGMETTFTIRGAKSLAAPLSSSHSSRRLENSHGAAAPAERGGRTSVLASLVLGLLLTQGLA